MGSCSAARSLVIRKGIPFGRRAAGHYLDGPGPRVDTRPRLPTDYAIPPRIGYGFGLATAAAGHQEHCSQRPGTVPLDVTERCYFFERVSTGCLLQFRKAIAQPRPGEPPHEQQRSPVPHCPHPARSRPPAREPLAMALAPCDPRQTARLMIPTGGTFHRTTRQFARGGRNTPTPAGPALPPNSQAAGSGTLPA